MDSRLVFLREDVAPHLLPLAVKALAPLLLLLLGFPAPAEAQVGRLDPTFGDGGVQTSTFNVVDEAWDVALQADGRIVVVGASEGTTGPNSREARVARYLPDGALDQSWTYNSFSGPCTYVPETFYTVAVEPDGHLLAGGYAQFDCSGPQRDFWIHRLTPSGTSVRLFDRPVFGGITENVRDLTRRPDGLILAVGFTGHTETPSTWDVAVARYLPDGSLDDAFGTAGEVTVALGDDRDIAYAVAAQPDGKTLVVGFTTAEANRDLFLLRLGTDGTLDAGFGEGGIVTMDGNGFDDTARGVALQPDGKIVVVGTLAGPDEVPGFLVARYTSEGTLDASFGTDGIVVADFGGLPSVAASVVIQPDGKIVAAGHTETGEGGPETADFAVVRLLPDGTFDASFAEGGVQTIDVSGNRDIAHALAIQPDGHLVLVGYTEQEVEGQVHRDFALARILGDSGATAAEDEAAPQAFALHAAYPNPTAGHATLAFDLPQQTMVRLAVYDALGRHVAVLVEGERAAGRHEAVFDATGLPSGMYLVRIEAGAFAATRRLVLSR